MGIAEDKVIKNHYAAEYVYNTYKNAKTCGVIEEDKAYGIKKIAEPVGIIGAVIPTTNPTSTAIFKTLLAIKTRNGIIVSPHPRAKKSTVEASKIVLEAAVKAGAPENIIAWIDVPTLEMTNMLMRESDLILATGGPGMVKAAYSSGKPAIGVGPGNAPAVIDDTADIKLAVSSIIHSKTFDNGVICASEQSVIVLDGVYGAVKAEFANRGCHILTPEETDRVRAIILNPDGSLNAKIVGQKATTLAEMAGVNVFERTKVLIGEVESVEPSEPFAHEKLSPILAMYRAKDFKEASELGFAAAQNMLGYCYMSGLGTEQSLAEGIMWYELAVGQQDDDAEFNLATCYLEGKGTQVNKEKAIELLTRSAERDNVKAISTLGICYETGDGVQPDKDKAISLYRRAADQGDEYAIQALQQLDDQEIPATDDNGNIEF